MNLHKFYKDFTFSSKQLIFIVSIFTILLLPDLAEARRGGGFGGGRSFGRSFGSSRSFGSNRSFSSNGSRIQNRSNTQGMRNNSFGSRSRSSFGGNQLNSKRDYTSRYGRPRKTETVSGVGLNGGRQNYSVNSYGGAFGGYSSGLMTGYLMGHTSMLWFTPFHPAFYFSRPHYVSGANGKTEVFPPTFSFGKLLFALMILGIIVYVIMQLFKNKSSVNREYQSKSSFG